MSTDMSAQWQLSSLAAASHVEFFWQEFDRHLEPFLTQSDSRKETQRLLTSNFQSYYSKQDKKELQILL